MNSFEIEFFKSLEDKIPERFIWKQIYGGFFKCEFLIVGILTILIFPLLDIRG